MNEIAEPQKPSRERLRELVIEGCLDMAEVNKEIAAEWRPLDDESWPDY